MVDWIGLGMQVGGVVALIVGGVVILGIITIITYFVMKNKAYDKHKVIVWKRYKTQDGKEIPTIVDRNEKGMIKYDKKLKRRFFHLKNANCHMGEEETKSYDEIRDLDIPSIPCEKGGRVVFVEKLGVKKYAFGETFIIAGHPVVIISAADCAEAMRSFDNNAKTFGKKPNQVLAFTLYVILAAMILVMIIVVLQKFELIAEAADKFAIGAQAMRTGAAVPSGVPG